MGGARIGWRARPNLSPTPCHQRSMIGWLMRSSCMFGFASSISRNEKITHMNLSPWAPRFAASPVIIRFTNLESTRCMRARGGTFERDHPIAVLVFAARAFSPRALSWRGSFLRPLRQGWITRCANTLRLNAILTARLPGVSTGAARVSAQHFFVITPNGRFIFCSHEQRMPKCDWVFI